MVLGVLTLAPLDEDGSAYATFAVALLVLLPLVFAGGFEWDDERARWIRPALWTAACVCLAGAVVPVPAPFERVTNHHAVALALFAVSAAASARLPGRQAPLRDWLASVTG
jgi:hypothetical protein